MLDLEDNGWPLPVGMELEGRSGYRELASDWALEVPSNDLWSAFCVLCISNGIIVMPRNILEAWFLKVGGLVIDVRLQM